MWLSSWPRIRSRLTLSCGLNLLSSETVSWPFFVFHDLDIFDGYKPLVYRLSLVLDVSGISSCLGSDYALLTGTPQKGDSFSLMVELKIWAGEGLNGSHCIGPELKIPRRTGEKAGGEVGIHVCVCARGMCVVGVACVCKIPHPRPPPAH